MTEKTNPLDSYTEDPALDRPKLSVQEWEDGITGAVRTLGNNKMDVVFAGEQAMTNGERVVLPKLADGAMLTTRQDQVGRGYAHHETLHKLLTDFDVGGKAMQAAQDAGQKLLARMINAVEDVRIENGGLALYPGMPTSLNNTAEYSARSFLDGAYRNDASCVEEFKRIGPVAVTWAGRKALGYESPMVEAALSVLPDKIRDQVEKWATMILGLETGVTGPGEINKAAAYAGCADAINLAKMLTQHCIEGDRTQEEDNENEGRDETEGEGEKKKEDGENGNSRGTDDGDQDSKGSNKTHSNLASASDKELEVEPLDPDMQLAAAELMSRTDTNDSIMGDYRVFSRAEDTIKAREGYRGGANALLSTDIRDPSNAAEYRKLVNRMSSSVSMMRNKLRRALMSRQNVTWESGRRRGKLHRRSYVQVAQGRKDVFRRKVEGDIVDTAVAIHNDCSGSMIGHEMVVAAASSIALAEALEGTGVALEVSGMSMIEKYTRDLQRAWQEAHDSGHFYDRTAPAHLLLFKPFEDTLRQSHITMGGIARSAAGSTPDGPCILMAWQRLKRRPESKKIMLVLTDGGSGWRSTRGRCDKFTRDVVRLCTDEGCLMIGVGIGHSDVKYVYDKWSVINSVDDLSKTVIDEIARMIMGDSFKADNRDLLKASGKSRLRSVA